MLARSRFWQALVAPCMVASAIASNSPAIAGIPVKVGVLEPFTCGNSKSAVVTVDAPYLWINEGHKQAVLAKHDDANCGYVVYDWQDDSVLIDTDQITLPGNRQPQALKVCFQAERESAKDILVRMWFRPQSKADLIVVEKPLSEFHIQKLQDSFWAVASKQEIWGSRPGAPNLRKIAVIVTKPGNLLIGGIEWAKNGRHVTACEPAKINLTAASCDMSTK